MIKKSFYLIFSLLLIALLFGCSKSIDPLTPFEQNAGNNKSAIQDSAMNVQRIPIKIGEPNNNPSLRKIVVLKTFTSSDVRNISAKVKAQGGTFIKRLPLVKGIVIVLPETASDKARKALLRNVNVIRIDDDVIISASPKPVKPPKPDKPGKTPPPEEIPWGIDRIDADEIWFENTGEGIKVGILDTGINIDHPDLAANFMGGINFVNPKKTCNDDNGHGTHVAGTVAAISNEIGVIGVAPKAHLYAVKVLDRSGSGYLSDLIDGLDWCIKNDIKVVNMSLGTTADIQSFHEAITNAYNHGITLVAAAGNEYPGPVNYPAAYSKTIAVSAINESDQMAYFSCTGEEIDLAAPGVNILSTYKRGGYKILSGTSMATPHVTGVAALVLKESPGLSPDEVKSTLKRRAEWLNGLTLQQQGAGLVDAQKSISLLP